MATDKENFIDNLKDMSRRIKESKRAEEERKKAKAEAATAALNAAKNAWIKNIKPLGEVLRMGGSRNVMSLGLMEVRDNRIVGTVEFEGETIAIELCPVDSNEGTLRIWHGDANGFNGEFYYNEDNEHALYIAFEKCCDSIASRLTEPTSD